jgi:5,10-methylenetetrahydrofolate reductase
VFCAGKKSFVLVDVQRREADIHFYTLNKSKATREIWGNLGVAK